METQIGLKIAEDNERELTAKVNTLCEKIKEAKTLAGELASALEELRFHVNVVTEQ